MTRQATADVLHCGGTGGMVVGDGRFHRCYWSPAGEARLLHPGWIPNQWASQVPWSTGHGSALIWLVIARRHGDCRFKVLQRFGFEGINVNVFEWSRNHVYIYIYIYTYVYNAAFGKLKRKEPGIFARQMDNNGNVNLIVLVFVLFLVLFSSHLISGVEAWGY